MNSAAVLAFQAVPAPSPGDSTSAAPAASQVQPSAPSEAPGGGLLGILPLLLFVPLILLVVWQGRSQQKKQEAAISGLKKGDKVVTQGGIVGRLSEIDSRYARLEIAPGVKLQVLRSSLAGRDTEVGSAQTTPSKTEKDAESGNS
ncbi:MAG TPA: preprotein translocase subunit YajC [Polyangiaceae bacterium]|nr:preprotein translocase subunit YajC [Polyangiaceae bacterium]